MGRKKFLIIKCNTCGEEVPRDQVRLDKKGHLKESICKPCHIKQVHSYSKREYDMFRPHKLKYCQSCGFKGHTCQLDIDHIDNNFRNNDLTNLQTLCANCHRLKTYNYRKQKSLL